MKINRLALLTFAAASVLAGAGMAGIAAADKGAGMGHHGPAGYLKAADANNDGAVDQGEFNAGRDKFFGDLDANKDGFVAADELKAFAEARHAAWMKNRPADAPQPNAERAAERQAKFIDRMMNRVDGDKDGRIAKAEFDAAGADMFKRMDDDGDGRIAADEMPQGKWGRHAGKMFDRADADKDGKVTKAEFTAAGEQMFQRMDKNGDGVLEKDEMGRGKGPGSGGDMPPPEGGPEQAPNP